MVGSQAADLFFRLGDEITVAAANLAQSVRLGEADALPAQAITALS